ncbi:MAG: FixH family protein [Casimicrobiaceae bacterium]
MTHMRAAGRVAALLALAFAVAACATAARAATACGGDLAGVPRTVASGRYTVAYITAPDPIVVGRHFVVDFAVCARAGSITPQAVRVDASMPEHKHGMNYRPGVTTRGPGMYRAQGLMFHMPGRWELSFDVVSGNTTERLTDTIRLD